MDEIKVINIFKRCSDKEVEGVIKSPAFLFAAIWSYLAHSWLGPKYMCKEKYETLGNRQVHYNYFSITKTSSFFKRFVFHVFFSLSCYMHLSKFTWK